jgi:hypothetical protein
LHLAPRRRVSDERRGGHVRAPSTISWAGAPIDEHRAYLQRADALGEDACPPTVTASRSRDRADRPSSARAGTVSLDTLVPDPAVRGGRETVDAGHEHEGADAGRPSPAPPGGCGSVRTAPHPATATPRGSDRSPIGLTATTRQSPGARGAQRRSAEMTMIVSRMMAGRIPGGHPTSMRPGSGSARWARPVGKNADAMASATASMAAPTMSASAA